MTSAAIALAAALPRASAASVAIDLDQHQIDPGDALGHRQAGGADAGAEIDHAIARTRRRRRRQQHGVMAGAVAGFRLPQPQLAAEKTRPR